MANIKLDNLARSKNILDKPQYTYSDLHVDLKFEQTDQAALYSNLKDKDLAGDYDLGAIKNSIINFFTSFPGDKILNPEFGINLNQFLFLPATTETAQNIEELIKTQLYMQDPRVKALKIEILLDADNDQYNMTFVLAVPFINNNTTIEFRSILNSTGVNFYS